MSAAHRAETVGIVGAGKFGTALASALARGGRRVVLCTRHRDVVEAVTSQRQNPRFPDAALPELVTATSDDRELARSARFIVLSVVSHEARDRARTLGDALDGSHIVVHAIGALPERDRRMSEVIADGVPTLKIGALAGPALPLDLAAGNHASMVIASAFEEVVHEGRRLLNAPPGLRVYTSKDLVGVELASALAGAYTIALGLADGLELGPGPRAVLITRAVSESGRLGAAAGGDPRTFAGLAGLGNLLVRGGEHASATGVSALQGRGDYALGLALARGEPPTSRHTEGARVAAAAIELAARLRVRVPVLHGVASVLAGTITPQRAAAAIGDTVAEAE